MLVAMAGPFDPKLGERTEPEDKAWTKSDVDRIREPEHAHRDRRIAHAAKNGIEAGSGANDVVARGHGAQEIRSEDRPRSLRLNVY
jgi:hypothetical protein